MKETYGSRSFRYIFGITFLVLIMLLSGSRSAYAETRYQVVFNNHQGTNTGTSYSSLNKTVEKDTVIALPEGPVLTNYVNIGWTTKKGGITPLYKVGTRFKVVENVQFYIVRASAYNVSFAKNDGTTDTAHNKLLIKEEAGKTITMPGGPVKTGYTFLGWATKAKSSVVAYRAGEQYTPTQDQKFYSVYVKNVTVSYMSNSGNTCYKQVTVKQGEKIQLPGRANASGSTFLGWATVPGKSSEPEFLVGNTITLQSNLKLYTVQYKKVNEYNYTASKLPRLDTTKYKKIIFVGDSRTNGLYKTLKAEFAPEVYKNVSVVAKGGIGLNWLKETGYDLLLKEIGSGGTSKKPIVVVFNLGVNDPKKALDYVSYMKQIEPVLEKKYCKLVYTSVNPVNNIMLMKSSYNNTPEERIAEFNNQIRTKLCNTTDFIYINTHSYLIKKGFGFDNGMGINTGIDDGLHYTTQTYKKIYAAIINYLNEL